MILRLQQHPFSTIASLAFLVSVVFCFVIYPLITNDLNAPLDIDGHGLLGQGLYYYDVLSFYPNSEPTITRGPIYPLFISFLLTISNNWYPYIIQLGQCILFTMTCMLTYWTAKHVTTSKIAFWTGIVCSIHPYLIWFISRIYVEVLATTLFTAIIASSLYFSLRPSFSRAFLLGIILGLASLTKATFLPFIFIVPLFLLIITKREKTSLSYTFCIISFSLVLILPWVYRNWELTNRVTSPQALLGYNLQIGDSFVENFGKGPMVDLWYKGFEENIVPVQNRIDQEIPEAPLWKKELVLESITLNKSILHYLAEPWFFIKKIFFDAIWFWYLAPSWYKILLLFIIQTPLLILFSIKSLKIFTNKIFWTVPGMHISLVWFYYLQHLPIMGGARFSVVLIPTMLIYAASVFDKKVSYN